MAGKHTTYGTGLYNNPSVAVTLRQPPVFPGSKADKAYEEGRRTGTGFPTSNNPHESGSDAFIAFENGAFYNGNAACKIQTAVD